MMLEIYPNLKEKVGILIPGCEISSLLDRKLARWSTALCALALGCRPSISKKEKKKTNWDIVSFGIPSTCQKLNTGNNVMAWTCQIRT